MPPIPKPVLGAALILMGLVGISGCASKNAEISSLKRLHAAQQERIDELRLTKADMQRLIDLKIADLEREKQARLQAERELALRPVAASAWLPPQVQASPYAARVRSTTEPVSEESQQPAWRDAHATSEIVRQAQSVLKQAYYYHGPLDGACGPQTRRAITAYQRAQGLANGGLTLETLHSLGLKPPESPLTADMR